MHYYPFNIGDYARRAQRLTLMEDLAYRRLLDLYYLDEQPFNERSTDVLTKEIGMIGHEAETAYIIDKFFPGGFNKAADEIIDLYRKKKKQNSKAGKASAKARRLKASERTLNECITSEQPTNNQEPRTNNHSKDKEKKKVAVAPKFNFKSELINIGVSKETAGDWLLVRKKKKAANTKTAFAGLVDQIDKSKLAPEEAIKHATENSWSGFKASWLNVDEKGYPKPEAATVIPKAFDLKQLDNESNKLTTEQVRAKIREMQK